MPSLSDAEGPAARTPAAGRAAAEGTATGRAAAGRASLRERKKARTRAAIQKHAMSLFRQRGYQNTTVEDIAEAAEVSQSTFFRYFPSKEDVVLYDAFDPLFFEAVKDQPPELGPIAAVQAALRAALVSVSPDVLVGELDRQKMVMENPELRVRMLDVFARSIDGLAEVLGERLNRPADDFDVRTLAGAVIGVGITAWFTAGVDLANTANFVELYETALARLDEVIRLAASPPSSDTRP